VHAPPTKPGEKRGAQAQAESRESQLSHIHQDLPPLSPGARAAADAAAATPSTPTNAAPSSAALVAATPSSAGGVAASDNLPPDARKFLRFAEVHRTVLNHILRQSNGHLADGPFSVLVDHTRILDFDVKRKYFRFVLTR
jgi:E3 ubiquitin-protein ligase HUWE1